MSRIKSYALRSIPGGGTEKISTLQFSDNSTGDTVKGEQYAKYVLPLVWNKIGTTTSTLSTTAATEYPNRAAITITTGNTTSVTFSGAFAFGNANAIGLLLLITQAGTNVSQVRQITANPTGNQFTLSTSNPLPASISASDTYDLMIDCQRLSNLVMKVEFSGSTSTCVVRPVFYSINEDTSGATAAPIRYLDHTYSIDNSNDNLLPTETSYYHGEIQSSDCSGAMGARIKLVSITGGGTVSLWAASI